MSFSPSPRPSYTVPRHVPYSSLIPAPHVILSPTFPEMWGRIHRGEIGKVLSARALYGWAGPQWGQWF
jgi:hypothetical protein